MNTDAVKMYRGYYKSPIGDIEVTATEKEICSLEFVKGNKPGKSTILSPALRKAIKQLDEYFRGKRRIFELMLRLEGSEFQLDVWQALLDVPYGATVSYGDIAKAVGRPEAVRAVGAANGANPISLIIPCHRVIGADGRLVGYGGGLDRKEWLIEHEWKHAGQTGKTAKAKSGKGAKARKV
jgi:methylated-DNA-[protein]-cysteine S-methyltransferase